MKLSLLGLATLSLLVVAACSSSSSLGDPSPAPAATTPPPTTDNPPDNAIPPAPAPCADGTYRVTGGACAAFPGLAVTRSPVTIAPARDHHTTTVIETTSGTWLYVFGGTTEWTDDYSDIQRAKLNADGSLAAFAQVGSLTLPRAGHCMVRKDDRIYLFGGIVGEANTGPISATSTIIHIDAEGQVLDVKDGPKLPLAVMHASCDLVGNSIYVMGGRGMKGTSTTMSAHATINADGSVSEFDNTTPLSPDRSHHASLIHDKRLYLVGGLTGDPAGTPINHKDVVSATIGDDGKLGAWEPAGTLPTAIAVSSAQLYKDAIYIFGGLENNATFSSKIRRASFNDDGTVSAFATMPTGLPDGRGHVHQTPMWGSYIYSVGGQDANGHSLGNVDIGKFDDVTAQ